MDDRSLLERAAKAAGIVGEWVQRSDSIQERWYFNVPYDHQGMLSGFEWNPLLDDGDALRLAVKLNLPIMLAYHYGYTAPHTVVVNGAEELRAKDPYAATRRAITRAAAELSPKE